jgi:hypothetical protein
MFEPLRDSSRSFGARMKSFLPAYTAFARSLPEKSKAEPMVFVAAARARPEELAAAEKRLGLRLPRELASFLREIGQFKINQMSSTTPAKQLLFGPHVNFTTWDRFGDRINLEPGESPQEVLNASVLLYTEMDSGVGGLFYRPEGSVTCKGPAYYYVNDAGFFGFVLQKRDGSCRDYTESMIWLIANLAVDGLGANNETDFALIDSSAPGGFRMILLGPTKGMIFHLDVVWREME